MNITKSTDQNAIRKEKPISEEKSISQNTTTADLWDGLNIRSYNQQNIKSKVSDEERIEMFDKGDFL